MKRLAAALLFLAAGCRYSTLDHASPEADRITNLHWVMFWICGAVFFAIIGFLAISLVQRGVGETTRSERLRLRGVAIATIASTLLLLYFLAASVFAGRAVATPAGADALEIQVIGHQWWWEVRYPSVTASQEIVTANEIHVPAGNPVRFLLQSDDVIHSFWIPNLDGKKDLIPGRLTTLTFRARRPGVYLGRCAEFCGYQHAHMGLVLIVDGREEFQRWLDGQRRLAAEPADAAVRHGRQVFLSGPCVLCHTIRGAGAFGHRAPDLTHLASRTTIAAGTLANTPGHLAGWIIDAQRIKPGCHMPPNLLSSSDLLALVSYLQTLR
jgi:cytochrome c oxidase subunit II